MTRSQTTIPFHNLTFHDDLPNLRDVEKRLTNFLKTTREKAQRAEIAAGRITDDDRVYAYDLIDDADKQRIKGRAIWFLERQQAATGMQHLSAENRVRLTGLRGGLPVGVATVEAISMLGWSPNELNILSLGCVDEVYMLPEAPGKA